MTKASSPRSLATGLALAIAYFAACQLGTAVRAQTGVYSIVWFASGIGLAGLVLLGRHLWPWILLSALAFGVHQQRPAVALVAIAVGSALESWLGAKFLVMRSANGKPTLTKLREVMTLAIFVMGIAACASSTLQILGLYVSGDLPPGNAERMWRSWWLGEAMGAMTGGVVIIAWQNDIRFRLRAHARLAGEGALLAAITIALCILNFTPWTAYNSSSILRPYFLFTLMLWAALRFDLLGVAFLCVCVTSSVIGGMLAGFVPFQTQPAAERMIILQCFIAALGVTGLALAASMREKMQALDIRDEFLGIASHELKTPITSMKLQLQLARRRIAATGPGAAAGTAEAEYVATLERVDRQSNRLVQIIDQLLDVSRVDRRVLQLQLEPVDLAEFVSAFVERARPDLVAAGCALETSLQPGVTCRIDPSRFEQVLENLFSNATKYASGRPLRLATSGAGTVVEIVLEDRGDGIDPAKLPFIFERFVRANSLPQVKGLGLGLYITRQIVQAHGGSIKASSAAGGKGTVFRVELPQAFGGS